MKIAVIYGSVREHRQGIKGAKFVLNQLDKRDINYDFIDAKEYNLPFLNKMYKEFDEGKAPENIQKLHEILDAADGYIIVSGEYNHGTPPALKNLLDHYQKEFFFKPSGLATYSAGNFGGIRNAMHLRAVTSELGMPSIPTIFTMNKVYSDFDKEGNTDNEHYEKSFKKFINEFLWYAEALKEKRKEGTPY